MSPGADIEQMPITLSAIDVEMMADGETVGPWLINGEELYLEIDGWELDKLEVSVDE